jgi:hypothetical protein
VLLGVRAAAHKVELPEAHLPVLRVCVLVVLLLVGGVATVREGLDRLERRRRTGARREVVVVVVRRGAGQGGEVSLRAGAAHVVGAGAAQTLVVAGDGQRVVRGRRGFGEVDGRGGDGDRR